MFCWFTSRSSVIKVLLAVHWLEHFTKFMFSIQFHLYVLHWFAYFTSSYFQCSCVFSTSWLIHFDKVHIFNAVVCVFSTAPYITQSSYFFGAVVCTLSTSWLYFLKVHIFNAVVCVLCTSWLVHFTHLFIFKSVLLNFYYPLARTFSQVRTFSVQSTVLSQSSHFFKPVQSTVPLHKIHICNSCLHVMVDRLIRILSHNVRIHNCCSLCLDHWLISYISQSSSNRSCYNLRDIDWLRFIS